MIFKVQQSLFSSTGKPMALIYNEDRTVTFEGETPKEVRLLLEGRPKAYFECTVHKNGLLDVLYEVDEQDW